MSNTRQLVADPKVLLKGVRDAQGRIAKLQEENEMLKGRLLNLERGGPLPGTAPPYENGQGAAAGRPGYAPPPPSVYAQTDIDDQSFLVLDFGGKGKGGKGGLPPGAGPFPFGTQPASPTATESSMQAYNNPAFVEDSHAQQEAQEWKQMYIDTLKHLRQTKEDLEKERQVGRQLETELRQLQVGFDEDDTQRHSTAHSTDTSSAVHTAHSTQRSSQTSVPQYSQHSDTTPIAAAKGPDSFEDSRGSMGHHVDKGGQNTMPPSAHQQLQQQHQIPPEFLQKYRQLGMGHDGEPLPQLKPEKSDVYVLDPEGPHLVTAPSKGPIVFDVRTGVTYTESPTLRTKPSVRMNADNSFTSPGGGGGNSPNGNNTFLGKPKRRVEHSMSALMAGARDKKGVSPWMRNLFSCVAIDENATK